MLTLRQLRQAIGHARRMGVGWENPVFIQVGQGEQTYLEMAEVTRGMVPGIDYDTSVAATPFRTLEVGSPEFILRGE